MWIMDKWKEGSQWLYDKFGSKLQEKYDNIDSWQTPSWAKDAMDKIWEYLDEDLKKTLFLFTKETCAKFDNKFAKDLITTVVKKLLTKLK